MRASFNGKSATSYEKAMPTPFIRRPITSRAKYLWLDCINCERLRGFLHRYVINIVIFIIGKSKVVAWCLNLTRQEF